MGRVMSLGALARREAVLGSCLAAAGALAALSVTLGAPWLAVVGALVAAAGALIRVGIAVVRAWVEGHREKAVFDARTRVRIAPVREIDPTLIGVDAAAQDILPGKQLPDYAPRDADAELHTAVKEAIDGTGRWIVVALGTSKVGKSRALFQALLQCAPDIDLVAPVSGDALRSLMTPGETPRGHSRRCILWLDDLEPFLDQDVTFQTLREWHTDKPGRIVLATLGGKGAETVAESGERKLASIAADVLQHAREVGMQRTTSDEIAPLRATLRPDALASIERHGLAAYLVAAEPLERKLLTEEHEPRRPKCPEGVAIVYAVADWARCGRTDPISNDTLQKLWPSYLPPGVDTTDEGFQAGLKWALKPVAGTIALIRHVDGYRAYDYIVQFVEGHKSTPPRDDVWVAALALVAGTQALRLGLYAAQYARDSDAILAYTIAGRSPDSETAIVGNFNVGVLLGLQGHREVAITVYDEIIKGFTNATKPLLRDLVARALVNKGVTLAALNRYQEAHHIYDDVLTLYSDANEKEVQQSLAMALINDGAMLSKEGRPNDAIVKYDEVLRRFRDAVDADFQEPVAKALVNKGMRLGACGQHRQAISIFDEAIHRFSDTQEPGLQESVAKALVSKGIELGRLGDHTQALTVFDEVLERFGEAKETGLRVQVANTLVNRATALGGVGAYAEGMAILEKVITDYGDDPEPGVYSAVGVAFAQKSYFLGVKARWAAALPAADEALARLVKIANDDVSIYIVQAFIVQGTAYLTSSRPQAALDSFEAAVLRTENGSWQVPEELAARALVGKGTAFASLRRTKEAEATLDDIQKRFGSSTEPFIKDAVRRAATMKRGLEDADDDT